MDVEKLRNLTDAELAHQERELNDQLFRMKFQLKMGQTESLNKIHGLRKDVARIKTILREKQLGLAYGSRKTAVAADMEAAEAAAPAAEPAAPVRTRKSAAARKTAATKKASVAARAKKKSASAKAKARKK
jgi:large subunit ribosomal protein L29